MREVVNSPFYLVSEGIKWRAMPHDLRPWPTVYGYFTHWRREGIWESLNDALRAAVRQEAGHEEEPSTSTRIWRLRPLICFAPS